MAFEVDGMLECWNTGMMGMGLGHGGLKGSRLKNKDLWGMAHREAQ